MTVCAYHCCAQRECCGMVESVAYQLAISAALILLVFSGAGSWRSVVILFWLVECCPLLKHSAIQALFGCLGGRNASGKYKYINFRYLCLYILDTSGYKVSLMLFNHFDSPWTSFNSFQKYWVWHLVPICPVWIFRGACLSNTGIDSYSVFSLLKINKSQDLALQYTWHGPLYIGYIFSSLQDFKQSWNSQVGPSVATKIYVQLLSHPYIKCQNMSKQGDNWLLQKHKSSHKKGLG